MPSTPVSPTSWTSNMSRRTAGSAASSSRYTSDAEFDDGAGGGATRDEPTVGRSAGREVGVTRPKRRMSSISTPSISPTFATTSSSNEYRAASVASSTPGSPPVRATNHGPLNDAMMSAPRGAIPDLAGPSSSHPSPPPSARLEEKHASYTPAPTPQHDTTPRLFGIELKWISLVTLALQNAFLTIIMHYSRVSTPPEKTYSAAAAVLLNELLKGFISTMVALKRIDNDQAAQQVGPWGEKDGLGGSASRLSMFKPSRLKALRRAVFSSDCYKLAVPAILYVIQNNLQYVAASNLDVATFQVTYQMKILTTAFFSVLMLGKRLSKTKWGALVMLAVGVGIVQLQSTSIPKHEPAPTSVGKEAIVEGEGEGLAEGIAKRAVEAAAASLPSVMHPFRGFVAVTLACFTSGLAGVYFELLLKSGSSAGPSDLWVRNTQLSLFSLIPALVPVLFSGHEHDVSWASSVASKFANFNGWAIGTVLTQTFGGLITALVIKYSDNILKGFATSLSIILSFLASVALFNYPVTAAFVIGASIVLAATYMYNAPSKADGGPSRAAVGVAPGSPIPSSAPILGEPQAPSRTSNVINLLRMGGSRDGPRRDSEETRPFISPQPARSASPYNLSPHPEDTELHELNSRRSPSPSRLRPNLQVDTAASRAAK